MKKNIDPDYRREVATWLKNNQNISVQDLSRQLNLSPAAIYGWVSGNSLPTVKNFERLKQLASIGPPHLKPPGPFNIEMDPIYRELMGHIKQLTTQVKEAQGDIAVLKSDHEKRMAESEKKIRAIEDAAATQAEQLANRIPREEAG